MNYDKSKAAEDKIYIYESPDNGKTIYQREVGQPVDSRELIKEENQSTLVIEWTTDDVKQVRNHLSFSEACEVIKHLSNEYDGNRGISWTTIAETADKLFPKKVDAAKNDETLKFNNYTFWNE